MSVVLFDWIENTSPLYGAHGKMYRLFVSDMPIGTVTVAKAELLSKPKILAKISMREAEIAICDEGIPQAKAWVENEFMNWFMAVNKLARAYLEDKEAKLHKDP